MTAGLRLGVVSLPFVLAVACGLWLLYPAGPAPRLTPGRPEPLERVAEADVLRTAASVVQVAGLELALQALPWQDAMPGSDVGGLMVLASVRTTGPAIAPGVAVERVYVVRDAEVW
ncbi:MAG: hypothetical protein V4850_20605 [Myxococcota bacterium]